MTSHMASAAAGLAPISLAELNASAELLVRTDRKYVIDAPMLHSLVADHRAQLAVLQIGANREFTYESVYFDTDGLDLYRAAATGRRWRYKVRTRHYADSDVTMLEVKTKDGRGRTLKHRQPRPATDRDRLTPADQQFIDVIVESAGASAALAPTLTTRYQRSTLVALDAGYRATFDHSVECAEPTGRTAVLKAVIVETKSDGAPSPLDQWLWRRGRRPVRISKYCTALASLHPDLPANKWHRTLAQHFATTSR